MNSTFSKEEKAAMRAAAAESKAAKQGADLEAACLAAIAEMSGTDQKLAQTLHQLVKEHTTLGAKTWYGMPAYTNSDGKVVVFFQSAAKFKGRYATIGFQQDANLDDGHLWPSAYAVTALNPADQLRLVALLKQAVS